MTESKQRGRGELDPGHGRRLPALPGRDHADDGHLRRHRRNRGPERRRCGAVFAVAGAIAVLWREWKAYQYAKAHRATTPDSWSQDGRPAGSRSVRRTPAEQVGPEVFEDQKRTGRGMNAGRCSAPPCRRRRPITTSGSPAGSTPAGLPGPTRSDSDHCTWSAAVRETAEDPDGTDRVLAEQLLDLTGGRAGNASAPGTGPCVQAREKQMLVSVFSRRMLLGLEEPLCPELARSGCGTAGPPAWPKDILPDIAAYADISSGFRVRHPGHRHHRLADAPGRG